MSSGVYRVAVTAKGFKVLIREGVKIDAGVPATANGQLELGAVSETVEVQGGAELVQTASATLNTTLESRFVRDLPQVTRGGLDLLVSQTGVQTGGTNRSSRVNGLPSSGINVTLDGVNTQDQTARSSDSFFTFIPITQDSIEEVTLTTSAASADATGEGAAQIKFVTKSGTNEFHGGVFEQIRNTALNANTYFNNLNGLSRDRVQLNQFGGHVGGPVWKNKLFFFTNLEFRRMPESGAFSRTVLTPGAMNGDYTYQDPETGSLDTVNVLRLAQANGYQGTADPIVAKTLGQINDLVKGNAGLIPNVASSGDYVRDTLNYLVKGTDNRTYSVSRVDYNINAKNQLSITYSYNKYNSVPDVLNSTVPIYPGTGTVLGDNATGGQTSNRFLGTIGLRSTITPNLTNEFHSGLDGGTVVFNATSASPAAYSEWRGYNMVFGSAGGYAQLAGVSSYAAGSRRNAPTKNLSDNMSWLKGRHLLSWGGSWMQVNMWSQSIDKETLPEIDLGINGSDPIHNGDTDIFTNANFPNATQNILDDAATFYANLTGRVTKIQTKVNQDPKTHQFDYTPAVNHLQQREFGLFISDSWKFRPSLTLTAGLRYEQQSTLKDLTGTYSSVDLASLWGISGIGNLFKPGVMTGVQPQYTKYVAPYKTPHNWNPSVGLAWQLPEGKGVLGWLLGDHQGASVLRAGYSISTVREAINMLQLMTGSNPGLSVDATVDPDNYPQYFGEPGSVTMSSTTLPSRPTPKSLTYPFSPNVSDGVNGFDPNLKLGYVQSWNIGFQREIGKNSVLEVRYTGNHGTGLWRQVSLNEANAIESGLLTDWNNAYNNLMIARKTNPTSTNFGNQGLAGQVDIPIIKTAYGSTNSAVFTNWLLKQQVGVYANSFATNMTRYNRLIAAGYPANMFMVNPAVSGGNSWIIGNWGHSYYDALQFDFRRRMTAGLMLQGSYTWGKALADGAMSDGAVYSEPSTFRNTRLDRGPSDYDIRHTIKIAAIYELPFGANKRFFSSANSVVRRIVEGWEVAGVNRNQSGTPMLLNSTYETLNQNESGVVLHNMTASQLQSMMSVRKVTAADGTGLVYYLPQSLIDNSNAAFQINGKTLSDLDSSAPYIGPPTTAGQLGYRVFLYGPWQNHFDVSVMKRTQIKENVNLEFTAQALNVLNLTNFQLPKASDQNLASANFGVTTSAYTDLSNAQDPGARMIEFRIRLNF